MVFCMNSEKEKDINNVSPMKLNTLLVVFQSDLCCVRDAAWLLNSNFKKPMFLESFFLVLGRCEA